MIKKDGKQMKMNNKLFLITATLGLMAAGSATAFAGDSYIYFQNNSSQMIHVTSNWGDGHANGDIHIITSTCLLAPGETGHITIRADQAVSRNGLFSGKIHVKYNGNSADMIVANVKADYSNSGLGKIGLVASHMDKVYIGTSAPAALNKMGIYEIVQGANTSTGTTANAEIENNTGYVYGVGNKYVTVNIGGGSNSPMGKISTMLQKFKF